MKRLYLILFILIIPFISVAQPAGYLGKRFTLSYDQLAGPNYFNLIGLTNIKGGYGVEQIVSETSANLNYTGSISLDYVVGKTKSRGVSFSPINQTIYFTDYIANPNNVSGYYYSDNPFLNNTKLKGFTIGAFVKYFKSKSIAPLGTFYKFELLYSSFNISTFYRNGEISDKSKTQIEPLSSLGFSVTYGKSRIIWNKVVVSTGISVGGTLNFFTMYFTKSDSYEFREIKIAAQFWHGQKLFYNFYLGIGFLLF
ncbi:MAG: hypothetical protein A2X08_17445 [Bacteroidetes bacterium GWA2_32_17]|nr:MAG: hypothetical protein A2X08_17445 [Bacteroidetes bacterium GWA2_32_17]